MRVLGTALAAAAILVSGAHFVVAQTWIGPSGTGDGGSWATDANWVSPANKPNGAGAAAVFGSVSLANRTITNDAGATGFTVGSISYTSTAGTTQTTSLTTGTAGSKLILDNSGAGATITTSGTGTGNMTISVPLTLNDNLTANINQENTASAAHSLNLTATTTGTGGFTKNGDGGGTFGTGAKTYTGATILNGGRMRISQAAHPSATSSFTINAGGQLELITTGTYTFGSGPLNLNGAGPTTGQFAPFPGAIRPTTGLAYTVANTSVVLQSDTTVHMQGSAAGTLTFTGSVSGPGKLLVGSVTHDANVGQVILNTGTNSYSGGTTVQVGALVAGPASVNAFGSGNVNAISASLAFGGSIAKLLIQTGANDAISNAATLSLAGGNVAGVADDGYADLEAGINETVGSLVLGGVTQTLLGTYGSVASGATFQFDEYFSGAGMITLAAAPGVPGDYNGNGLVDGADYVLWRNGGPLQNEVDSPGTVNAQDYTEWRARFGNTSGSGSTLGAAAVPEPSAFALLSLLVSLVCANQRRRSAAQA
jgi:fibronectin-binding autotransporter adhesin